MPSARNKLLIQIISDPKNKGMLKLEELKSEYESRQLQSFGHVRHPIQAEHLRDRIRNFQLPGVMLAFDTQNNEYAVFIDSIINLFRHTRNQTKTLDEARSLYRLAYNTILPLADNSLALIFQTVDGTAKMPSARNKLLIEIISDPKNKGILKLEELKSKYESRQLQRFGHVKHPIQAEHLRDRIRNFQLPGVMLAFDTQNNEYAVFIDTIINLFRYTRNQTKTLDEARSLYRLAYNTILPLADNSLALIFQTANISIMPRETIQQHVLPRVQPRELKPLSEKSILRDKYVPQHLKELNRHKTALQWDVSKQRNMDQIIAHLAREFIPAVPCTCGLGPNGHNVYTPIASHQVKPNYQFALSQTPDISPSYIADLDETDNIREYGNTFRHTIKLEYEENMRLYEHFSLYKHSLRPASTGVVNTARIFIDGILDAKPSLSISDIVLLRPIKPIMTTQYDNFGRMMPYSLEIESRIVDLVRGRKDQPDSVIISWELNSAQEDLLKDSQFIREYNIRFVPNVSFPQRCLTALDWLQGLSQPQQQNVKGLLFPVVAPLVKPLDYSQMSCEMSALSGDLRNSDVMKPLNQAQSSFVRMIRARTLDPTFESTRPACILTGPAGTGKTKTLITTIADVLGLLKQGAHRENKKRVLLCAPSHAAADVLTRRLSEILKQSEIFRMYDSSRPSNTVPGYILPYTCQLPGTDTFTLPAPSVWLGFRVVVCTCIDAAILYRAQISNHAIRTKRHCFVSYLRSNNPIDLNFDASDVACSKEPFFSHLFIDEAAQATEPEVLCPISVVIDPFPGEQKVEIALIGDPRQLSPRIYSEKAALYGLGRSFMERVLKRPVDCIGGGESHILGPDIMSSLDGPGSSLLDLIRYYANIDGHEQLTVFLTENYRGHPSFLMMPSSLFYYDRLRSAKDLGLDSLSYWIERLRIVESLKNRVEMRIESERCQNEMHHYRQVHRQTMWPIHFRAVKGKDTSVALDTFTSTDSWQNSEEADAAVEIVDALVKSGVTPMKIGVMTPFRGQVVAVRKRCREKHYHDVNVGTIENFQGVEQKVIILSLTRSNPEFVENDVKKRMGVFGMPKQANVALTRSENLFIVVGNPEPMWKDPLWKQWLLFCLRNGLWYGESLADWDSVKAKGLNHAKFVNMIEQVDFESTVTDSVVVSTIEKVHRVHSTDDI